ncbi:hypothetical protein V6N13_092866 [Hibiscus sabdariffa]
MVELEAILVGIHRFFCLIWANKFRLIVESDCKTVVDCILGQVNPLANALAMVREVAEVFKARNIMLRLIPIVCNVEVDLLAKKGIG